MTCLKATLKRFLTYILVYGQHSTGVSYPIGLQLKKKLQGKVTLKENALIHSSHLGTTGNFHVFFFFQVYNIPQNCKCENIFSSCFAF